MKLRNKKTGDAVYVDFQIPLSNSDKVLGTYSVTSLKELNEDFEDYMPAEPLIKDKKIRKAVRAWAEATGTKSVNYWGHLESCQNDASIDFQNGLGLESGDDYTIAELCGEEEE